MPKAARPAPVGGGLAEVHRLTSLVEESNACALPGCTIKYDTFLPVMWKAVARGYVKHEHAVFVAHGLRHGFEAGIQRDQLHGQRVFKNYKTAVDAMEQVARATQGRVDTGKTLVLGDWGNLRDTLRETVKDFYLFPLGAVPKPLEPTEVRPASDHTKTGLNDATDMTFLQHHLTANRDVAWLLQQDYFMYVSDVEAAFPTLPLAPWLWWFFLFRVRFPQTESRETLCMHTHGDFGTRGMPGAFYIFYVRVVVQMARSELIITLPLVVYVDDNALIGPSDEEANRQMDRMQQWMPKVGAGCVFKRLKDRRASQLQLYVGFWWNSRDLTLTLEERKLKGYVASLLNFAKGRTASLHDLRSLAGKAQRAVATLPPGAQCLLVNFFLLMAGLMLPWHKRRVPAGAKLDAQFLACMLGLNMGRGYYRYDRFRWAPLVLSDACKGDYAGGGYVSADGHYRFWQYGSSAARNPIDFLEGDTVLVAVADLKATWRGCMVPFGIDNMSFQRSEAKGRSRAPRLNDLLKELFVWQVQDDFIMSSFWLSSEANELADDLSRDREYDFLRKAAHRGFWPAGVLPARHPECGKVRHLSMVERPGAMSVLRQALDTYTSNCSKDGPGERGQRFASTVPHQRTTLSNGLPGDLMDWLDVVLDNKYSASSHRSIRTGMRKWRAVADRHGWDLLIQTDDEARGAKLVTLVYSMVEDTELCFGSIQNYLWGVRTWMKLQHQADPAHGVEHWDMFMQSVAVLTAVPGEPRKEIPLDVLEAILEALNPDVFWEAQFGFFILILYFTFSRSECPCPKTYDGEENFDVDQHWQVKDIVMEIQELQKAFAVHFKSVKQDPRVQRPQGRGGDWAYVGSVPEESVFSPLRWYKALMKHWATLGTPRGKEEPFFLAKDMQRPYIYSAAMADLAAVLDRIGCSVRYGLHGLRVAGYNAAKQGVGVDLTVAHGLWMSSAHTRYERFGMQQVLSIPTRMLGARLSVVAPRPVARPRPALVRGQHSAAPHAGPSADSDPSEPEVSPTVSSASSVDLDGGIHLNTAARRVARAAAARLAAQAARGAPAQARRVAESPARPPARPRRGR